jgi:hypothetical protein
MKSYLLFTSALLCSHVGFSQEIAIKKDIVSINGKDCLKVQDSDPNNVSFMDLEGNEIFFLKFIHNSRYAPVYSKVIFLDQKLTFTSRSYIFTKKILIKKLLTDGILENCALVPTKVENFVLKYDEKVEQ